MSGGERGERGGRDGMRGDRDGMRGDRRGGADVNVRIGGDRGYGRGYGHRRPGFRVGIGGGCRTVVVKKRIGYRVVIKKIHRCY
jgi:hypothetical protein